MLFIDQRLHFFQPLTGKYREQVACLRGLYARLYSSSADYSRVVQRALVMEVFQEAITQGPLDQEYVDVLQAWASGCDAIGVARMLPP